MVLLVLWGFIGRGLGLGARECKSKLPFLCGKGAKVGKIFLEVNEENLPAVSLYANAVSNKRACGKIITTRADFSSRDALIMAKTL